MSGSATSGDILGAVTEIEKIKHPQSTASDFNARRPLRTDLRDLRPRSLGELDLLSAKIFEGRARTRRHAQ